MKQVKIIAETSHEIILQSVVFNQWFVVSELEIIQNQFYNHKTLRNQELPEVPAMFIALYQGYLVTKVFEYTFRLGVHILARPDEKHNNIFYMMKSLELSNTLVKV